MKTVDLKVRPIHHRLSDRVRPHIFLCMLAYYVEWHLKEAWRELLCADEDRAAKTTRDPVAPAQRSEEAKAKIVRVRLAGFAHKIGGIPQRPLPHCLRAIAKKARECDGIGKNGVWGDAFGFLDLDGGSDIFAAYVGHRLAIGRALPQWTIASSPLVCVTSDDLGKVPIVHFTQSRVFGLDARDECAVIHFTFRLTNPGLCPDLGREGFSLSRIPASSGAGAPLEIARFWMIAITIGPS